MSEDKELWMTRAAACELLALSLRYPTDELARILTSGEWADAAREIAAALGAELSEDAVAELPAGDEGEVSSARRRSPSRIAPRSDPPVHRRAESFLFSV